MRYENRHFEAEGVVLDDNEFINCTFNDVAASYSGGEYRIEPLNIDGLAIHYAGPALRAVRLWEQTKTLAMRSAPPGAALIRIGERWFTEIEKPEGL